jgi:hypothetical protein
MKGNGYADYMTCLRSRWLASSVHHGSTCEDFKPRDTRLDRQGVEVLQVITRCRCNYQQGRWDEASALLALFEPAEWQDLRGLSSASARLDDKYTRLRKQVAQLLENDADLGAEHALLLPEAVFACLQDALRKGMLQHDCHRSVTSFPYERARRARNMWTRARCCRAAEKKRSTFRAFCGRATAATTCGWRSCTRHC